MPVLVTTVMAADAPWSPQKYPVVSHLWKDRLELLGTGLADLTNKLTFFFRSGGKAELTGKKNKTKQNKKKNITV